MIKKMLKELMSGKKDMYEVSLKYAIQAGDMVASVIVSLAMANKMVNPEVDLDKGIKNGYDAFCHDLWRVVEEMKKSALEEFMKLDKEGKVPKPSVTEEDLEDMINRINMGRVKGEC